MNKEEQEIIEKFKNAKTQNYQEVIRKIKHDNINDIAITRKEYIDVLLNYIDKLQEELKDSINARFELQRRIDKMQKENEELKEEMKDLIKENHKHIDYIASMKKKHKDKIRTKIKELEKDIEVHSIYEENWNKIEVLKELLGDDE